jgi:hypothetical protein
MRGWIMKKGSAKKIQRRRFMKSAALAVGMASLGRAWNAYAI